MLDSTRVRAVAAFVLLAVVVCRADDTRTVRLEVTASSGRRRTVAQKVLRFKKGKAQIDFAVPGGKLKFRHADGKLLADINADGKIDSSDGSGVAAKGTLTVPVKLGTNTLQYPLLVARLAPTYAVLSTHIKLSATVDGVAISLVDQDMDGRFGELGVDSVLMTGSPRPTKLMKTLAIHDRLYVVDVSDDVSSLKLAPYKGKTGELSLKVATVGDTVSLSLVHEDGEFQTTASTDRKKRIPAGSYKVGIARAVINRKDKDGKACSGSLVGYNKKARPVVVAEKGTLVKVGPPFTLEFVVSPGGKKGASATIKNASLVGTGGEEYRALCYGRNRSTLNCYARVGTNEAHLSKLEYG